MNASKAKRSSMLKEKVLVSLKGLEKGYGSVVVTDDQDDIIDDLVCDLEDENPEPSAEDSSFMVGRWKLLFTSSSLTRFQKGISGIHSLLPVGKSMDLEQVSIEFSLIVVRDGPWTDSNLRVLPFLLRSIFYCTGDRAGRLSELFG
mmetsp:Transcript_4890/g.21063  ORF Transcript_4890/g.21063 Transcript_4890/m.21063 type:complete len:146 (+) Transcript_4890:336-773(+)